MQISVAEAAEILGVDRATVWRYIKLEQDPLPAQQIGHAYALWRSEVEAFKPRAKRKRGPKPKSERSAPFTYPDPSEHRATGRLMRAAEN